MQSIILVGADDVANAARRIQNAAQQFADVVSRMEQAFAQRRQWEEEYLLRIEAIVERELAAYAEKDPTT